MTAAHDTPSFGTYLATTALRAGYNLGPNGRDRARFAQAVGMNPSNLTHMLSGERVPTVRFIRPIAAVLKVNPLEVLAAADGHTDAELRQLPTALKRYTALVAAEELNIPESQRDLFVTMVEQMRRHAA